MLQVEAAATPKNTVNFALAPLRRPKTGDSPVALNGFKLQLEIYFVSNCSHQP